MENLRARLEATAFWLLVVALAWAPFPLGSNRQWSASLLYLLVALAWFVWVLSLEDFSRVRRFVGRLLVPLILALAALAWGLVQTLPVVPQSWVHPLWGLASEALNQPLQGTISLNPWRTDYEVLKLFAYLCAAFLTVMLCAPPARAEKMLKALIVIGGSYGLYAVVIWALGMRQFSLFYDGEPVGSAASGPFVLHNSYATYSGLAACCAAVMLFSSTAGAVRIGRGFRPFMLSLLQHLLGRGAFYLIAFVLNFATLIFTASRAGFVSTVVGLLVLMVLAAPLAKKRSTLGFAAVGAMTLVALAFLLFMLSGNSLSAGLDSLVQTGTSADNLRPLAWTAATRMIEDSPWLGLGLGSYENAYPLYATQFIPFILDKTHSDYLELAAGWGLPAAIAWWLAMIWLVVICIRGIFTRRRDRIYPLLAVGATALVAVHSAFDFSLQIPAIALFYAVILGLGVAQAFSTRKAS